MKLAATLVKNEKIVSAGRRIQRNRFSGKHHSRVKAVIAAFCASHAPYVWSAAGVEAAGIKTIFFGAVISVSWSILACLAFVISRDVISKRNFMLAGSLSVIIVLSALIARDLGYF